MSYWVLIDKPLPCSTDELPSPLRADNNVRQHVERCFLQFRDQVFRYLRGMGCEHGIAEEITQETFLRLYRAMQTTAGVNDERAWAFRVARNLYVDSRRESQRYRKDDGGVEERGPADSGLDPEQIMLHREREQRIEAAVLELPELHRECMHLRAQGLRYREIAVALDISLSAAVEYIRSAVKRLGSLAMK